MDAIYRVDGNRVVASANAAGPWDAGMQHGSAPAALVAWAAEAESWIGPEGPGLAMARLADERGYFGRAIQSLSSRSGE
jgi:hypothetical protein